MAVKLKKRKWWWRRDSRIVTGFDRILLYDFDLLERHREFSAKAIRTEIKDLDRYVKKAIEGMSSEEEDGFHDYMYDEYVNTSDILPRLQWYAQFMVVYAAFENTMDELCRIVERRSSDKLDFKGMKGRGIVRAKKFLQKAGVKTPFQISAWQRAQLMREIRNLIAHRNGEIDCTRKDQGSLAKRLRKEKHVKLKTLVQGQEDAQIDFNGEFVRQAITDLRAVLVSVCNYELFPEDDADE